MQSLKISALDDIPFINEGDDLAEIILSKYPNIEDGDIFIIAQKIVSKAEGRIIQLSNLTVSKEAQKLADRTGRDPRFCQAVINESSQIIEVKGKVIVVKHKNGMVCTSAGIDKSNIDSKEGNQVILLPEDPDRSARVIRENIERSTRKQIAVIINDSLGQPNRQGSTGQAIGFSGIKPFPPTNERRTDFYGNPSNPMNNIIDEIASSASLLMGQSNEGRPIVVLKGLKFTRDLQAKLSDILI